MIVGFARLGGRSVGVVANQPRVYAGAINIDAATRAPASFVFAMLSTFRSSCSWMFRVHAGVAQESGDHPARAKMLYAWSESTVPKITCILRKAYGGRSRECAA